MAKKDQNIPVETVQENDIDLLRLLAELLDQKALIIAITVLFTLLAMAYALLSMPVYQADTLIQVEQNQGNARLSRLNDMISIASPKSAPEMQLLQSRMILGKTIADLHLRDIIQQRYFPLGGRSWARLTGKTTGELVLSELNIPRTKGKEQELLLTVGEDDHYKLQGNGFILEGRVGQRLEQNAITLKVAGMQAAPGTQFCLTQQTELEAINALLTNLTVRERSKESGMLQLTMTGEDPQQIVRILDSITGNYLTQNIAHQAEQDSQSLDFLQRQLPKVRSELDFAEQKLNEYRKQRESVDLNLEAKSVLEQIVNVENQLNELTFREAEISKLYKKEHPTYRALIDKSQTLTKEKERLNKRVSTMPFTQQEVLRLSRDVEAGRGVYLQLLNRLQELSIAKSSAIGNVRLIDPAATQPLPIKPKKALIVALGGILGLLVSVGGVLIRVALRRGIESPEQLEKQGISVYATIPNSEWLQKRTRLHSRYLHSSYTHHRTKNIPFLALDNPTDLAVEAVRTLRTSLHYAMMEAPNKVLMISGATPDSGKTFISSTLAAIVAQSEKKVLYIDADLRRGYAHNIFEMKNEYGLSDFLSGRSGQEEVVQHFARGGFDVITRGQLSPNPSELLMHNNFSQLQTWACERYDLVVIDTPAILAVTDAAIVGRLAGTNLLVTCFAINTEKEVSMSIRRFEQNGVNVKGAIVNGVVKRASIDYVYGYNYRQQR